MKKINSIAVWIVTQALAWAAVFVFGVVTVGYLIVCVVGETVEHFVP